MLAGKRHDTRGRSAGMACLERLGRSYKEAVAGHAYLRGVPEGPIAAVKRITPAHVLDVLNASAKTSGLTVVAEAKRTMSGIFELLAPNLRTESDPIYPVCKALLANKAQHKRPFDSAEIGLLLRVGRVLIPLPQLTIVDSARILILCIVFGMRVNSRSVANFAVSLIFIIDPVLTKISNFLIKCTAARPQ